VRALLDACDNDVLGAGLFSRPLRGLDPLTFRFPAVETAGYSHPSRIAGLEQVSARTFASSEECLGGSQYKPMPPEISGHKRNVDTGFSCANC